MDACTQGAGEREVEACDQGNLESRRHEFDLWIDRLQLGQGGIPVGVKIRWAWIAAGMGL